MSSITYRHQQRQPQRPSRAGETYRQLVLRRRELRLGRTQTRELNALIQVFRCTRTDVLNPRRARFPNLLVHRETCLDVGREAKVLREDDDECCRVLDRDTGALGFTVKEGG